VSLNLTAAESGCLLLADITGYTGYLQATELEHAQDVLADLLETIVETLQPVFVLSKLEGDAAFAYAAASSLNPTMIMDTVEAVYFAFRKRLRDIEHATSCDCNACVLIPGLDLKFFLHFGEYVVRRIAGTEELTGPDVVLAHRLMKGSAGEAVQGSAYAAYTAATMDKVGMNPELLGFRPHTDHFDDIGDVELFVQDLHARWAFEQERQRVYVSKDEAVAEVEVDVPVEPAVIWEYASDHSKRMQWQPGLTGIDMVTDGRLGAGSTNHCMHGPDTTIEHVADWRPFSYYTTQYEHPVLDGLWTLTTEFTKIETGTTVSYRVGMIPPALEEWWTEFGPQWIDGVSESQRNLKALLEKDLGVQFA
jgi:class 3 adenylate cyclase